MVERDPHPSRSVTVLTPITGKSQGLIRAIKGVRPFFEVSSWSNLEAVIAKHLSRQIKVMKKTRPKFVSEHEKTTIKKKFAAIEVLRLLNKLTAPEAQGVLDRLGDRLEGHGSQNALISALGGDVMAALRSSDRCEIRGSA